MNTKPVYLDHNATTPVAPEVAEAMWPYLTERFGNPSATNHQGRLAREAVEEAREQVAMLIGAHPDEVTFTSGGTESNNLAILGTAPTATTKVAVTSAVEHPATVEPLTRLAEAGWRIHRLRVDTARPGLGGGPAARPDRLGHPDPRPERGGHHSAGC